MIILDFGYPSQDPHGGGGYGVISVLDQNYQFYPNTSVANSVKYFAAGYYNNLDLASFSHLTIVVGVVNCCLGSDVVPALWPSHGAYVQPPWGSDANAWATLSVFSVKTMAAGPMFFAGSLTQREACLDNCGSGNNLSWEGFQLLSGALASNTTTRQAMRWSTDMKKQPTPTP